MEGKNIKTAIWRHYSVSRQH